MQNNYYYPTTSYSSPYLHNLSSGYSSYEDFNTSPLALIHNNSSFLNSNHTLNQQSTHIQERTTAQVKRKLPTNKKDDDLNESELSFNDENDNYLDESQLQNGNKRRRVLTSEQRRAANNRERKRMNIMNDAFSILRHKLPIATGKKRRKMSRLDIVNGAMEYIEYLNNILQGNSHLNTQSMYNLRTENLF